MSEQEPRGFGWATAVLMAFVLSASPAAAAPPDTEAEAEAKAEAEEKAEAEAELRKRAVDGLLHDIEKIVELQTSLGWKIDRYEYEEMMPDTLLSVCRATDETRSAALDELERRIEALGGPMEEAYRKNGGKLLKLEDLLYVSRVYTLLTEAIHRSSSECPFWTTQEPTFKGLQTDAFRSTLSLEGGGLFTLQHTNDGTFQLGAGGSGRFLIGYGLNQRWTLLGGLEFGVTAIVDQNETSTNFPLQFVGAVPVVVRRTNVSWHYDFELAPLGFSTQEDRQISFGLRGGFLIGVSTLRIRKIMPWAGAGLAVEYIFATDNRSAVQNIKGGARVGFDWDFE